MIYYEISNQRRIELKGYWLINILDIANGPATIEAFSLIDSIVTVSNERGELLGICCPETTTDARIARVIEWYDEKYGPAEYR